MELKDIGIPSLGMSVRTTNALMRHKILTADMLVAMTEPELREIRNLGAKSVAEALAMIKKLKGGREEPTLPQPVQTDDRQQISEYLRENSVRIDVLELLPARAYNLLCLAGYEYLYQIAYLAPDELTGVVPMMDSASAETTASLCEHYLQQHREELLAAVHEQNEALRIKKMTGAELASDQTYRAKIQEYARIDDRRIEEMNLSVRATNCLLQAGFENRSEILFETEESLAQLRNMGKRSVDEVTGAVSTWFEENRERIIPYILGETVQQMDDSELRRRILQAYADLKFSGLSFKEMKEKLQLPDYVPDSQLKKVIGRLLAEHELEYVDFRCHRVYPPFSEMMAQCPNVSEREIEVLKKRQAGEKLEAIGEFYGVTRERIRQIEAKAYKKCALYMNSCGIMFCDEDYYARLYCDYDLDKTACQEWLNIPAETYNYLVGRYKPGDRSLDEAVSDQELDVSLRLKIQNYLNRNKIFIDGVWVEKKRATLETYVLGKLCRDSVTFDEFVTLYNGFLEQQGIPFNEDLYITPAVEQTRENKLDESRSSLSSMGRRIRYYDIDSRDYTELLDELVLPLYENTEISTLKFMDDYPETMRRYDIRNQYELHNLLRKIVPEGGDNQLKFCFMPMIGFGEYDRAEMVKTLLYNNTPMTWDEFRVLLRAEYGYDIGTVLNREFRDNYYHNGIFTVDFKRMPEETLAALSAALTEDFYYFEEIQKIYTEMFPQADAEDINSYNLKKMGFKVYSRYALQHHTSADAFFRGLLTAQDIVDITPYRKRYSTVMSGTLNALKSEYTVLEYDVNQIINIRKLEEFGVTRDTLQQFCDAVYEYVQQGEFFTVKSLCQAGFESELFDLGFSDWFYANVLVSDPRFSYCQARWAIVFCKGNGNFTVQDFYASLVTAEGMIDIFDLMGILTDTYGCKIDEKNDITGKLEGSIVYYDNILGRLYASEELYQRDLDREVE